MLIIARKGREEEDPAVIELPTGYLEMLCFAIRIVWRHTRPAPSWMDTTSNPLPVFSSGLCG